MLYKIYYKMNPILQFLITFVTFAVLVFLLVDRHNKITKMNGSLRYILIVIDIFIMACLVGEYLIHF